MELDGRGVRIEHEQPLRTFLTMLPNTVPCEDPDACGILDADDATLREGVPDENEVYPDGEELPRPSPQPRQMDGPAMQGSPNTLPEVQLLPPPSPPVPPQSETMK